MLRFRFRLEAALRLAEQALEDEQRRLAAELQKLYTLQVRSREQANAWQLALEGQREAGKHSPQDLGMWQSFAQKQLERLRTIERKITQQEEVVRTQRQRLLEAHQEAEKLQKLKEKQKAEYDLAEQRREQRILDEAGQVVFRRKQELLETL